MKKTPILDGMGWPRFASVVVTALALGVACSGEEGTGRQIDGNRPPGGSGSGSGSGTGGAILGSGGGGVILPGTGSTGSGGSATREPKCDEAGKCSCINIAVFGQQGAFGAVPGMDGVSAIQQWLNENSSAAAALFREKPAITAEFLSQYDVIILEDPRSVKDGPKWQYSAEEIAAVETWIRTAPDGLARGIISLSGYSADAAEVDPTNALLAFSGMQYVAGSDTLGSSTDTCAYCLGNSVPQREWNAAHPISANISAVGAFHGRSVTVSGAAETVSTQGTTILAAAAQVDLGRVFMFHDEWVTYNSQWNGQGLTNNCLTEYETDPNHACRQVHPSTTYQTSTFWYNALKWVSGDPQCFDITDPTIIK